MKKVDEIKAGAIMSYVIIFLNIIVSLIYTPILIRSLGQSEYGVYSLISSIIAYFSILDLGFGNAIILYTTKYKINNKKEEEQKLHSIFLIIYSIIGILASLISCLVYFNIDNIFSHTISKEELEKAKVLLKILTCNLVISFPLSIFSSIITAYEKFVFAKLVNILKIVLTPIIMIPLLIIGYKSIALTIVIAILNVTCLVINMCYCIIKLHIRFSFENLKFKILKEIAAFSIWIFLNIIIDKMNWSIDQYILGYFIGTSAVSVYSIGAQINTLYLTFSTAISGVLLPKIIKMEEKNVSNEEFSNIFIKVGKIQCIVLGLILTGFILFGKVFMIIWAGNQYIDSYYIACILMFPMTVPLMQSIGLNILQAKNKHKFRTIVLLIIAIMNIIISIPLAQKYQGIGSAIGTAISMILGQIIILNIYYNNKIGINIIKFWKEITKLMIPISISFIIGFLYIKTFNINRFSIFTVGILLYTVIYIIFIWLLGINTKEKTFIKTKLEKILYKGENIWKSKN